MKPTSTDMDEGPQAFERFRKAVKKIVSVKKSGAAAESTRKHQKQRRQREK
jgi:hypothetical protein